MNFDAPPCPPDGGTKHLYGLFEPISCLRYYFAKKNFKKILANFGLSVPDTENFPKNVENFTSSHFQFWPWIKCSHHPNLAYPTYFRAPNLFWVVFWRSPMSPCCRGDPKKFKMKLSAKKPPETTISCPMSISARGRRRRSRDDRSTTIHKLRRVRSIQTITTPLRSGLIGIPSHGHAPVRQPPQWYFFVWKVFITPLQDAEGTLPTETPSERKRRTNQWLAFVKPGNKKAAAPLKKITKIRRENFGGKIEKN